MIEQLAVCTGDFEFAAPREFAFAERWVGRIPLVPRQGAVYRVVRLFSLAGAPSPYVALAEEPSGLGYRADWFWFADGADGSDLELAKLRALAQRPKADGAPLVVCDRMGA